MPILLPDPFVRLGLIDLDFLYLRFSWGLRDEDILLLLGVYLEYVEDKVVLRGLAPSVNDFVELVKYMRVMANYQATKTPSKKTLTSPAPSGEAAVP